MSGPWERYQTQEQPAKPWERYGAPKESAPSEKTDEQTDLFKPTINPVTDTVAAAKRAVGFGETVLSGIGEGANAIHRGYRSLGSALPGGETPIETSNRLEQSPLFPVYEPRTEAGKRFKAGMDQIGQKMHQAADAAAVFTGDEETALGNTMIYSALMLAPTVLGSKYVPKRIGGAKPDPAPSLEMLDRDIKAAYAKAEEMGARLSPESFEGFVDKAMTELMNEKISADQHPKVWSVIEDLDKARKNGQDLTDLEVWRRRINDAIAAGDAGDQRLSYILRRELEDYLDNIGDSDVDWATLSGEAQTAVAAIKEGRQLSRRKFEAQEIGELIRQAEVNASGLTASGMENALRNKFREVARNKDRFKLFTPEVREQIMKVVKGGNTARQLSRLAPQHILTSSAGSGLASAAGFALGGPAGAVVAGAIPPAIGLAARRRARRRTTRESLLAEELARRGGTGKQIDPRTGLTADLLEK